MQTLSDSPAASKASAAAGPDDAAESGSGVSRTVVKAGAGLTVITVIRVVLVLMFVSNQRERDLQAWQTRMGIVADSRFAAVNDWIEAQFGEMRGLAENVSLQLYLTELAMFAGDASQVMDEPAQRTYLRNLLVSTAFWYRPPIGAASRRRCWALKSMPTWRASGWPASPSSTTTPR